MPYRLIRFLLLTLSVITFLSGPVEAQNLNAGADAFESGDYTAALNTFRPLAEAGNSLAQYYLGVMYEDGLGVPQDYFEASKWHHLSSEGGLALAQNSLGLMYKYGLGVSQDYDEALRWFRAAALQGDVGAQSNLGLMYARGEGVRQDHKEAVKWYRMAAEQGEVGAQESLSKAYFEGQGVEQDFAESYKWARLAADQGEQSAIERLEILAAKLTPGQFAAAKRDKDDPVAGESESTEELVARLKDDSADKPLSPTTTESAPVPVAATPTSVRTDVARNPAPASAAVAEPISADAAGGVAVETEIEEEKVVLATGCDLFAAHPSDFLRPSGAVGVSFSEIDAGRAIEECRKALAEDPNNPRYQFQLARGLRKAKKHDEAEKFYRKAAEQGFALAQKSLAAIYPDAKAGIAK